MLQKAYFWLWWACIYVTVSPSLSFLLFPTFMHAHTQTQFSLEKMTLTEQISATLLGNQSSKHLLNFSGTTSSTDFTRTTCGNKIYVGVFSSICTTEAPGSFSKEKETEAGENVLQYPLLTLGGSAIFTGLFFKKIIFCGNMCVRREERKDLVDICDHSTWKEARNKTLALLCSFHRSVLTIQLLPPSRNIKWDLLRLRSLPLTSL